MSTHRAASIGLDFGTSNCLIAQWQGKAPRLFELESGERTLPSLVYVPRRMAPLAQPSAAWIAQVKRERQAESRRGGARARTSDEDALEERIRADFARDAAEQALEAMQQQSLQEALSLGATPLFGRQALQESLEDPEGFFFRSPKSFLAARIDDGLRARFARIVELSLARLRARACEAAGAEVVRACIGRPVHFGGGVADERRDGDARALALIEEAARRAGFEDLCFEFEPVAAALDFERGLQRECVALIVDVGGGTTDCTVARLGRRAGASARRAGSSASASREQDILASSGERVGGNDVDTALSFAGFMPAMGRRDHDRRGLPMPAALFADAAEFFDIPAQARFWAAGPLIADLSRDSDDDVAERLEHLETLRTGRHGAWLTVQAEAAKIALAEAGEATVTLDRIDPAMTLALDRTQLAEASRRLVAVIERLIAEALAQAGTAPQVVYVTGGSARSPLVREAIGRACPDVPIEYGDAWGSVVSGLAVRAGTVFA